MFRCLSGPVTPGGTLRNVLDLILPLQCGGCGAPSTRWCDACATELSVAADQPHVVNPRIDPQVPVFALGRYAGARRQAILAMKERGRGDLVAPLARALAAGVHRLLVVGHGRDPADRRARADAALGGAPARRRPGRPGSRRPRWRGTRRSASPARCAAGRWPATRWAWARPPASAMSRAGCGCAVDPEIARIEVTEVLVVDDVVTTGATARESVRVLQAAGARVAAVLTIAYA